MQISSYESSVVNKRKQIVKLFDAIERNDDGPAMYAEPKFIYWNRSAREDVAKVREVLEGWFSHYPDSEQESLRRRFRSSDDFNHRAAFFELFLHEVLLRLDCSVEIHPQPSTATTRLPDFLVQSPDGNLFYLEAVLATDESSKETAARSRMNAVYDALNQMDSPNFFIGMELRGAPRTPPPAKQIRSFLEKHLSALDPDDIGKLWQSHGLDGVPRWLCRHEGWEIEFYPIPKSPGLRGKPGIRPIGIQSSGWHWQKVEGRLAIRNAILAKAGRYGNLDLPYVIAVNALGDALDRGIIMEALFGQEQVVSYASPLGVERVEETRALDGAWINESGPRYTRVSAILIASGLHPGNLAIAPSCLCHNPWAKRRYAGALARLPQAIPKDGRMQWQAGESLGAILGLPPDWP